MRKLELRVTRSEGNSIRVLYSEAIDADSLLELAGKVPLLLMRLAKIDEEEALKRKQEIINKLMDDDIPF